MAPTTLFERQCNPKPTSSSSSTRVAKPKHCEACAALYLVSKDIKETLTNFRGHYLCKCCIEFWEMYPELDWRGFLQQMKKEIEDPISTRNDTYYIHTNANCRANAMTQFQYHGGSGAY